LNRKLKPAERSPAAPDDGVAAAPDDGVAGLFVLKRFFWILIGLKKLKEILPSVSVICMDRCAKKK